MTQNWDEALLAPADGPDAGDLGWASCVLGGIWVHSQGWTTQGGATEGPRAGFVSQALRASAGSVIPQGHRRAKEVLTQSPLGFPGAPRPALEAASGLCPPLAPAGCGGPAEGRVAPAPCPPAGEAPHLDSQTGKSALEFFQQQ